VPPAVAAALRDRLTNAPLVTQKELRPRQLAAQLELPVEEVVLGCLDAVDGGVLQLRWQLLCPRCQVAKGALDLLTLDPADAHCDSCGIAFDGALGDNIEAVFSVHPDVRDDDVVVHCALSPARTPHVVAQVPLQPGDAALLALDLVEGAYRVECGTERALIEVVPGRAAVPLTLVVGGGGLRPQRLVTGPGTVELRVVHRWGDEVPVVVMRQWRPPFVLTAASLLSLPGVSERLPTSRLGASIDAEVREGWVLVAVGDAEHLSDVLSMSWTAVVERPRAHLLVAAFGELTQALAFAEACALGGRQLTVSMARGPYVVLGTEGSQALGGRAVDDAVASVERVGCPRLVLTPAALRDPGLQDLLMQRRDNLAVKERPDGSALVVFAAVFSTIVLSWDDSFLLEDDEPPEQVGPYRVLRELDRGGMGMVLEGAHVETGHRVALKVVLPSIASESGLQQQFCNEAWYADKLDHPNVVAVEDFGLHDEQPWIAMEFLVGRSLSDYLRRSGGRLPLRRAWEVVDPLLCGLAALHEQGLVHRDIKPKNVFLARTDDDEERVKLLDFGLVRRAGIRRDEGLMGTPDYMAPEQLLGDPPGPPLDVFAIGVMLVRLVVGRYPFEGTSSYERALGRVGDFELPDLTPLGKAAPVVAAALAPEPADRPTDAAALRQALADALGPSR